MSEAILLSVVYVQENCDCEAFHSDMRRRDLSIS